MIKEIRILEDFFDHNGNSLIGQHFNALLVENKEYKYTTASIDVGADYAFALSNNEGNKPSFEIVGEVSSGDQSTEELKGKLEATSKNLEHAYNRIDELQGELKELENKSTEIERGAIDGGYAIIPVKYLDKELADEFKNNEECIITPKEIVAMCASAQLEINKGDVRPSSLNVKLYNAISGFSRDELDSMIEAGKSGQA